MTGFTLCCPDSRLRAEPPLREPARGDGLCIGRAAPGAGRQKRRRDRQKKRPQAPFQNGHGDQPLKFSLTNSQFTSAQKCFRYSGRWLR